MKPRYMLPVIALGLIGVTACDDKSGGGTGIGTTNTARVQFVNAIRGSSTSNLLLTSNGSVVGSSQPFGSGQTTCSTVQAGTATLAYGTANTAGTGIGTSLGTSSASFASGGSYTVVATGASTAPALLVLNNAPASTATSGNVNVRFVNATGLPMDFFTSSGTTVGTATSSGIGVNASSTFVVVPATNNTLTFRSAGTTSTAFQTAATFTSGGNYTVVLMPNATGTNYQTLVLNGC